MTVADDDDDNVVDIVESFSINTLPIGKLNGITLIKTIMNNK